MKKTGTVLVTGGTGFIGTNVVNELVARDFKVTVLSKSDLKSSKINNLENKLTFLKADLSNAQALNKVLQTVNPSIILHLAANNNRDRNPCNIKQLVQDNLCTTLNLYNASLKLKNLCCFVTLGSAGEYEQNQTPFVETQKELPTSPYALSKVLVSDISSYFYRVHNLPIINLRPFLVYGEYQTNEMFVPLVIRKCLKNEPINMTFGEQAKDFLYVKDLVDAVMKVIETNKNKNLLGETINICTGKEITLKDVALLIKKETNSESKINFGAIKEREKENLHFYGSNEKAKLLLNWSPKYSFEEGIKNTLTWYKEYLERKH